MPASDSPRCRARRSDGQHPARKPVVSVSMTLYNQGETSFPVRVPMSRLFVPIISFMNRFSGL